MKINKVSYSLKILIVLSTIIGVALSFIFAKQDGYTSWQFRLLYFTLQSNLWIAIVCCLYLLLPFYKASENFVKSLYVCNFVFTVSITVTGVVFCALLAPFAYKDGYNAWSVWSILLHAVVPALAICDFFVQPTQKLSPKHVFSSILPPLIYFLIASVFCLARVDFGRGHAYPYFFMNYYSPVGVFGFGGTPPFVVGVAYWILLFLAFVLSVAFVYYKFNVKREGKGKTND